MGKKRKQIDEDEDEHYFEMDDEDELNQSHQQGIITKNENTWTSIPISKFVGGGFLGLEVLGEQDVAQLLNANEKKKKKSKNKSKKQKTSNNEETKKAENPAENQIQQDSAPTNQETAPQAQPTSKNSKKKNKKQMNNNKQTSTIPSKKPSQPNQKEPESEQKPFDQNTLSTVMQNWASFGLREEILHALYDLKFYNPTPIQHKSILAALNHGKDIIGAAETVSQFIHFKIRYILVNIWITKIKGFRKNSGFWNTYYPIFDRSTATATRTTK